MFSWLILLHYEVFKVHALLRFTPSAPFRKELLYHNTIPQLCQHLFSFFSSLFNHSSFSVQTKYRFVLSLFQLELQDVGGILFGRSSPVSRDSFIRIPNYPLSVNTFFLFLFTFLLRRKYRLPYVAISYKAVIKMPAKTVVAKLLFYTYSYFFLFFYYYRLMFSYYFLFILFLIRFNNSCFIPPWFRHIHCNLNFLQYILRVQSADLT